MKLTANIMFSGIGCQERGILSTGLWDLQVLTTSDICKESVLSYAAIHCGLTNEMVETYQDYPSRLEMAQYLKSIDAGYDPKANKSFDWGRLIKRKDKLLEKYWLAYKLSNNLGNIKLIKELPYADLWTCSFPCTDISVAGKMEGLDADSGTRSSLLWDNMRLLERAQETGTLPKYILFENVKNLVGKDFIDNFNDLLKRLDDLGFNCYWQILNACECGVPQSRERVFVVCIRKDVDSGKFEFQKPFDNDARIQDLLDDEVGEKYYIDTPQARKLIEDYERRKDAENEQNR